jgi:drug/metabolite transporter (DMT)-like permease
MAFWRSRQAGGIALIVLATLSFASLDTSTKYVTQLIPVLMLLWFRYVFQTITTLALRYPVQKAALWHTRNARFQVLRGVLLLITTACSFFGLQYLPVGELTAMMMLSPVVATAMAAWFLKTHVARLRWWLLSGGLLGVLFVVRPGGQVFGWPLVFPVGLVTSYAWFQVLTSRLSGEEDPYTTHFYTGLVGAMVLSPVMLFTSWKPELLLTHWHWFLLVGFLGTFGHLMLIRAYGRASAPVLTPYLYTQIGFATLGGWLVFDHVPDLFAWIGIGIIAASGVGNTLLSMAELSRQARLAKTADDDACAA